ncbi:AsmA family protein [Allorhizobium undicola]|uniref:AsmA family protein n=1 Tax=Allorhizobium undicola TaxID=78527 RepID=UPI000685766C|nr:AsmA family protein [Allorhizobium undicola]
MFIAVGGLVVLVLFAALLAPLFVNWTGLKENFEAEASRILGKKVVVQGTVAARLLPFPSVTLNDVTIGPGEDGQTLVRVASFSMDAELAPFLSGEARIFSMRVERPQLRLRLLTDGSLDWLRGSRPSLPARNVVLENVSVTGGEITFIDEQTGTTRKVTGLDAALSARSLAGPWTVNGRAALDGQAGGFTLSSLQPEPGSNQVSVKIHIAPDRQPIDVDLAGDLALLQGRPTLKGSFSAALRALAEHGSRVQAGEKPMPRPRAKGHFELANDRIRLPDYRLEIGTTDDPYVITGEATLDTGKNGQFLLTAEGQQIDVDRLTPDTPKGKTGRLAEASVRQRIRALLALADQIPVPSVPGRASLKLPAILAGDTVIRDVTLDLRPNGDGWQVEKAVALLPGRTQVEASGRLRLRGDASFTGALLAASNQPSGLAGWLAGEVDPALRQLRTAGFSADVQLTEDMQRFDKLELAMGGATLHGHLERRAETGVAPSLSFDLNGNAFDYETARALASLVTGDAGTEELLRHQIAGKIKVGAFSAFGLTARDVDSLFTFKDGGFSLRKLEIGDLAGASITANGEAAGSLADYNGKAQAIVHSADASAFLAMLARQFPDQPLLAKIGSHGRWYGETSVAIDARFGDQRYGGIALDLKGKANGTEVAAHLAQNSLFDPLDDAEKSLTLTLANNDPATLLGQLGFDPLPLPGDGPATLALELKQQGAAPASGKLDFAAAGTSLAMQGSINLSGDVAGDGQGHLTLNSDDLEPLLTMNAAALPNMGQGLPVALSADIQRLGGNIVISQLKGTVDENPVSGQMNLAMGEGWRVDGALSLDHADLGWLAVATVGSLTAADGTPQAEKVIAPIWGTSELALVVDARTLALGDLPPANAAKLRFSVVDGALQVENLGAEWLGGTLEGQASLSVSQQTAFLRGKVSARQVDLAKAWPSGRISGRGDLDLQVDGSGASIADLAASLNGSGKAVASQMVVTGLDFSAYDGLQKAFMGESGEVSQQRVSQLLPSLLARQPARFERLELPISLSQGRGRVQGVQLPLPQAVLHVDGSLALASATLDARLVLAFPAGEDAPKGSDPELVLKLSGPLRGLEAAYDVSSLANDLSARALERERRRVETLQANVLEKQRLRREAAYYAALAAARQTEKARLDEERRRAADAEVEKMLKNSQLPAAVNPPPALRPQNPDASVPHLNMESLPGVN